MRGNLIVGAIMSAFCLSMAVLGWAIALLAGADYQADVLSYREIIAQVNTQAKK